MTVHSIAAWVPAQGGDRGAPDDAFNELYRRYRGRLLRYLRRVAPHGDIEGIAQETFCRALAHIDDLSAYSDPWPWLAVTARNLSRNQTRIESATAPAGLRFLGDIPDSAPEPEEQAVSHDRLRRLCRALVSLSPVQRQLLTLLLTEGMTVAEAGRRLGIREATARQHLCRMRARLTSEISALGGRLAVLPLAALGVLRRVGRARPDRVVTRGGVSYGSLAVGATLAIAPFVAGTLGIVGGADAAPNLVILKSGTLSQSALQHATPGLRHMDVNPPARATSASPAGLAEMHKSVAGLPATAHAFVSKTPTHEGTTLVVEVSAGPVHTRVNVGQNHGVTQPACDLVGATCP